MLIFSFKICAHILYSKSASKFSTKWTGEEVRDVVEEGEDGDGAREGLQGGIVGEEGSVGGFKEGSVDLPSVVL